MKTRIVALTLAVAGLSLCGCTYRTLTTANGTSVSFMSLGTNTQLGTLKVDLRADGSGLVDVSGLNADQVQATNAAIAAVVKALVVVPVTPVK